MPESIDKIRKDLAETALYHGMSYAAIVGVASEIEAVTDKAERAALRREFRAYHSLTAQVWARVAKRFKDYADCPSQLIRGMAYCCQLPEDECDELYNDHILHMTEPGALHLLLSDVNAILDTHRRTSNAAKRATPKRDDAPILAVYERFKHLDMPLSDKEMAYGKDEDGNQRVEDIARYEFWQAIKGYAALPAVASVLAKRGKAEK